MCSTIEVHILSIDHRHGTDTTLHITAEEARVALLAWVTDWWHEWADVLGEDTPVDDQHTIEKYFDQSDESYTLTVSTLTVPRGRVLLDLDEAHDLIDSKIELLADDKLGRPQDYEVEDLDRMRTEINRLTQLRDHLPTS